MSWNQQNDAAFRASQSIRERILELHHAGRTIAEISEELGISLHRVAGYIGAAASARARQAQRSDALVMTLRLPIGVREIVKLMKAIKEALPDHEWTVDGAYTEMRLIGRRREGAKAE